MIEEHGVRINSPGNPSVPFMVYRDYNMPQFYSPQEAQ